MATEEIYDRLRLMTGTSVETHDDALLDTYLDLAHVPDAEGNYPGEEEYETTFDLHRAASLVYLDLAAGKARFSMDTQIDQTRMNRSQILKNFRVMARWHEMKARPREGYVSKAWPAKPPEPGDNVSVDA